MLNLTANCLPDGTGLFHFFAETDAAALEVRACLTNADPDTGETAVTSDATAEEADFFAIYIRSREGHLTALHDLPPLRDANAIARSCALAGAVRYAIRLASAAGYALPVTVAPSIFA